MKRFVAFYARRNVAGFDATIFRRYHYDIVVYHGVVFTYNNLVTPCAMQHTVVEPTSRPYSHTITLIKNTAIHVREFLDVPTSALRAELDLRSHSDLLLDTKQQEMTMKTFEPTIQNKEIIVRCFADTLNKFCDILARKMQRNVELSSYRKTMATIGSEEHVYNIKNQTENFLREQWECLSLGYLQNYDDDLDAALEAIINMK